jgi:hypothetical protein
VSGAGAGRSRRPPPTSIRVPLLALLLALGLAATGGCHRRTAPVARLLVEPSTLVLGYPQARTLDLSWTIDAPLGVTGGNPTVFVHLLDEPGSVLRTFDHPLPGAWRPGSSFVDTVRIYQSALAQPLRPGRYQLSVGLYDQEGRRWPLAAPGPELDRYEYGVATVVVPADSADIPRFLFSNDWLPRETGTDRQVLARRWLSGPGSLKITGVRQAGTVWLGLRIPPTDVPGSHLVLEPGGEAPSVVVSASCTSMETGLSGSGEHDVELPVPGDVAGGECEIRITPNFYLTAPDSFEHRSLVLENLAWTPQGS